MAKRVKRIAIFIKTKIKIKLKRNKTTHSKTECVAVLMMEIVRNLE